MRQMLRTLLCVAVAALGMVVQAPVPAQASGLPGTYFSGTFTNSAGSRTYLGYVPSTYSPGTAVPLVVALHACTLTVDVFRQLTKFDALAEVKGFIVVFPQQSSAANSSLCWNWNVDADMHRGAGEPSIIAGITGFVQQNYNIDPKRIFVAGLSAGAAMAAVMGATYPDVYAAVGIGSGCEYDGACGPNGDTDPVTAGKAAYQEMGSRAREMPVLVFHGDADPIVNPNFAFDDIDQWQVTADWADDGRPNGSVPFLPVDIENLQVPGGESYKVMIYVDHFGAELAELWYVHTMVHAWGGGCTCEPYSDPNAPDESSAMYTFFLAHPHP